MRHARRRGLRPFTAETLKGQRLPGDEEERVGDGIAHIVPPGIDTKVLRDGVL